MSEYRIERLNAERLKDLVLLYGNAFRLQVDVGYLRQKYATLPFGAQYIGFLAYAADGTPAAYYGVFPIIVVMNGQKVLAAQSGDTMTHTEHRKKGLFMKLAKATFELAQQEGVKFIFGFPNQNSYSGFMKLDWVHDHDLNLYRLKVGTLPLAAAAKKFKWFSPAYRAVLPLVLGRSEPIVIPNSCTEEGHAGVLHDETFFSYKNYSAKYRLRVAGCSAYIKIEGRMFVGDTDIRDEQQFDRFLARTRRIAFWCGANEIEFQASPGTYLDRMLSRKATAAKGLAACFFDLGSGLPLNAMRYTISDADTF